MYSSPSSFLLSLASCQVLTFLSACSTLSLYILTLSLPFSISLDFIKSHSFSQCPFSFRSVWDFHFTQPTTFWSIPDSENLVRFEELEHSWIFPDALVAQPVGFRAFSNRLIWYKLLLAWMIERELHSILSSWFCFTGLQTRFYGPGTKFVLEASLPVYRPNACTS